MEANPIEVLIFTDARDVSTIKVCKWLKGMNCAFIVVTEMSRVEIVKYDINTGLFYFRLNGVIVLMSKETKVWYRRGRFSPDTFDEVKAIDKKGDIELTGLIKDYLTADTNMLFNHFYAQLFRNSVCINNYLNSSLNKLNVLRLAIDYDISVPPSIVVNTKSELIEFIDAHGSVITKSTNGSVSFETDTHHYSAYTEEVDLDYLATVRGNFGNSFFQKKIDKIFEIRSFYLDNVFYSMAIFSQRNAKTRVDFRKYDLDKPNRNIPFKLPEKLTNKLRQLLNKLKLSSASIDLIYGTDRVFHFLEINPVGQFGMTSRPCNYRIEKKIAEILAKKNNSYE